MIQIKERILYSAAEENRLAQAYLLSGGSARAIATNFILHILCEKHTACKTCKQCKFFLSDIHPDVFVLDGTDKLTLKLEDAHEVSEFTTKKSREGGSRVIYIIDAHKFNLQSQNYLLKCMEDPGDGVVFVLTSEEPEKLLPTVLSRCISVRLPPLPVAGVLSLLGGEFNTLNGVFAAQSDGYIQKAHNLSSDKEFLQARECAVKALNILMSEKELWSIPELISEVNPHRTIWAMTLFFRDAALKHMTGDERFLKNPDSTPLIDDLAECFTISQLGDIIDILIDAHTKISACPGINAKLLIDSILVDISEVKV